MQFRATRKAFFDASRLRPGQLFDAPDDFSAPWAEPVTDEPVDETVTEDTGQDDPVEEPVKKPDKAPSRRKKLKSNKKG